MGKKRNEMEIKKVFVVGAGQMGTGIAQVALTGGYDVTLNDISAEQLEKARKNIDRQLAKGVEKGRLTEACKMSYIANLKTATKPEQYAEADFIIEAASEDAGVKTAIFKEISKHARKDIVLATNTSSIPITSLAATVDNPGRFVGMHFFHPVHAMRLLEIVRGLLTSDTTVETAKEIGEKIGKETIVAKDNAGFVVNRALAVFLNEAIELVEKGISTPEDIDRGMRFGLGHPIGPFELMDGSGLDLQLAVMEKIYRDTGDPKYRSSPLLRRKVEAGHLGRKTGRGWYDYS
jgi:3-hydroxybutyryl-CoA dehydrogenase